MFCFIYEYFRFGLSSRFDTDFPASLTGKLAPEELEETIQRINFTLRRTMRGHGRWLMCGLLFCCCTFGCSLWPMICLNSRVRYSFTNAVNKLVYYRLLVLQKKHQITKTSNFTTNSDFIGVWQDNKLKDPEPLLNTFQSSNHCQRCR